jgi:hypothetical protein
LQVGLAQIKPNQIAFTQISPLQVGLGAIKTVQGLVTPPDQPGIAPGGTKQEQDNKGETPIPQAT